MFDVEQREQIKNETNERKITMSSGNEQEATADDFSGLGGFFFYVFIVHPITAWILRPGRFDRKKSIMYAIAFLAALAAVKTGEYKLFVLIVEQR